nr:unnamed protein product [Callosobruchus analis]
MCDPTFGGGGGGGGGGSGGGVGAAAAPWTDCRAWRASRCPEGCRRPPPLPPRVRRPQRPPQPLLERNRTTTSRDP